MASRLRAGIVPAAMLVAALIAVALIGAAILRAPQTALAQAGSGSVDAREHLRRGTELARQGLFDGAAAEFRAYVTAVPGDPEGHFLLGRSLLEVCIRKKIPLGESIDEFETSLRLDPKRDEIKLQLAEIYGKRIPGSFNPDKMISLFEELVKIYPTRFDIRLWYAQNILSSEIRVKRDTDPKRVLQDSGWAMELARFHFEKVIDQAPRGSDAAIDARTGLAEIQYRSGEWDAARANYEYLVTSFPDRQMNYAAGWNSVGHCHYRKGDYRAAAEAFRKAYDISPTNVYLYDVMLAYDKLGGYPKELPARYRFPLREEKYDRAAPPNLKFTDIAPKLHIDKYSGAGPCAWADYNGDGRMDLIACGCDTFCTLYRAEGDGFVDATLEAKLGRLEPGFGAAWGDYDNDGDPDLYIARNGWNGPAPNSLLRNNGDGTFTDVATAAGVADAGSSFHCQWLDYNRDGWLDLIVSNGVYIDGSTNQLYRNNGNGTFTNATAAAGMAEKPMFGTIGVAVGDYDGDGWPDIFYHGRMTRNRLYHNNHDGTFTDVAEKAGVAGPGTQNGYIALFSDLDSDGDLDIFTGSLAAWDQVVAGYRSDYKLGRTDDIPRFYRNQGNGTFVDASLTAGFRYPLGIMAGSIADLDNDGYQDIYLGNGNPELRRLEPNIFYHNRRGQTFEDLTRFTALGNLGKGHGVTFFDWDGDGDLDVYHEFGGFYHGDWWHSSFYLNELGNRNHWLQIRLQQPEKNRDAIGAHVTVHCGELHQIQVMTAGRGFGSTDPPILHYGLGRSTRVERVEIRWPDGERQVVENPPIDRLMTIRRESGPPATAAGR